MPETVEPIQVLHVDDEPEFARLVATFLEREDDRFEVATATSPGDGLDWLEAAEVDCVVSDYDMPGTSGIDFLEAVRALDPELPFILFTGKGSEEIASDAISAGVTDYLQKGGGTDQYTVLANRITNLVAGVRSRRTLAERTRRLETLISNLPGIVYRSRAENDWPLLYVDGESERLTGYTAEQLEAGEVGWGSEVVHPLDRDRVWETVETAIAAGEPFEVTYRAVTATGDTKWFWERGRATATEGGVEVLEGFIADVTERVERERDLERYRTLVETVGDPMYVLDRQGMITMVNEATVEETGYPRDRLVGDRPETFIPMEFIERATTVVSELLVDDSRRSASFEMEYVTADGRTVACENKVAVLTDGGNFAGTVGVIRDLGGRDEPP